jgi:hypothetical protein
MPAAATNGAGTARPTSTTPTIPLLQQAVRQDDETAWRNIAKPSVDSTAKKG